MRAALSVAYACLLACNPEGLGASTGSATESTTESTTGATTGATTGSTTGSMVTLQGAAQKGPFILGSSVTVSPLTPGGDPTGQQFESATDNNLGQFTIAGVPTGPVGLLATGYHYDEIRGGRSQATLSLRALHGAGVDAELVNLHVLGHIAEPRARALVTGGATVADALDQAEDEAVAALGVGVPGLALALPAAQLSVAGPDTDDNAYVFALSAVLMQAAHSADPDAVDAALQALVNGLAADLADDGALAAKQTEPLAAAETALKADAVRGALSAYLAGLGLPADTPDLHRVLDQDHDGLANKDDNCDFDPNQDQADGDGDGLGDACDGCPGGAGDQDGDGYDDGCDNCPLVYNPEPPQSEMNWLSPSSDIDGDGLGNVCDDCPQSAGTGGTPGENCCDPRQTNCVKTHQGSTIFYGCHPFPSGNRFGCEVTGQCSGGYLDECQNCGLAHPCMPSGAIDPKPNCQSISCMCDFFGCITQWCTVGDDAPCLYANTCIPWFAPGEAPPGLQTLGVCGLANQGPCAGKTGRECASWSNNQLQ